MYNKAPLKINSSCKTETNVPLIPSHIINKKIKNQKEAVHLRQPLQYAFYRDYFVPFISRKVILSWPCNISAK